MKCFCFYGIALALLWLPMESSLHSRAQNFVNASVNKFHSEDKNFDNTSNDIHQRALLAEKENNESYTFGQMLKQKDADDLIHAIIKEADDHEKRNHWEVLDHWNKPLGVETILDIWDFRHKRFPGGRINKHKA